MTLKRNMAHPNFILGLLSYILLLTGIVLVANSYDIGKQLVLTAVILGAIQWVISMINVLTDPDLKDEKSRYFWFAIVLMIPPLAGMIYYMIEGRQFSY